MKQQVIHLTVLALRLILKLCSFGTHTQGKPHLKNSPFINCSIDGDVSSSIVSLYINLFYFYATASLSLPLSLPPTFLLLSLLLSLPLFLNNIPSFELIPIC